MRYLFVVWVVFLFASGAVVIKEQRNAVSPLKPYCIESHEDVVPPHPVSYVSQPMGMYGTALAPPTINTYMTESRTELRCDRWEWK